MFKKGALAVLTATSMIVSVTTASAATSSVSVSVSAGSVSIEAPASASFPASTSSNAVQTLDVSAGQFTVEDLKGATAGYYTTISISDLSDGAGNTIAKANVTATVASGSVALVAGNTNAAVTVPTTGGTIGAGYVSLASAVTLLQRSDTGSIQGKYGTTPALRIAVPAYTPAGSYTGTITYTLIEN